MIHITAQMRVLVAIESVDGRKGIDSSGAGLPGDSSRKTQSPAVFSFSGAEEEHRFDCSAMTARDIGLHKSAFPKGGSRGGRNRAHRPNGWRLTKPSC